MLGRAHDLDGRVARRCAVTVTLPLLPDVPSLLSDVEFSKLRLAVRGGTALDDDGGGMAITDLYVDARVARRLASSETIF